MKCTNCGSELPDNALFCANCGKEAPLRDASAEGRFCSNCGKIIEAGAEFCGECGAPVGSAQKQEENYIFCGSCGAKNPASSPICAACGRNLHTDNGNVPKGGKKKYGVIVIAVLVTLAIFAAAIAVAYKLNSPPSAEDEEARITASPEVSPSPAPTAEPTPTPTPEPTESAVKYETYYVVNCNESISLRESPSTSASVLREIPLGSPVSYVEPAQNGFAKVIYNGVTGYALQAYLSDDSDDIQKSSNVSGANQTAAGAVENPSYRTFTDSKYNFSCKYPSHFVEYTDSSSFVRYSLKAPDNTATLKICATSNTSNLSVQTVLNNFKSSYPGTADYENSGADWCVCRTREGGEYHYGYFKLTDGMIRGFEMHFDENYYSIYDEYVNDIYDSLKF
ncbi:MAG: zinc-ribbon domain-containing protein [Firmicutes bacterium]|nr:zinc-ribbon domain-containing protein [Bacillota bacterium]